MPYELKKSDKGWVVRNKDTGDVKGHFSKGERGKAQHQINLLRAVKHGWRPTHKRG